MNHYRLKFSILVFGIGCLMAAQEPISASASPAEINQQSPGPRIKFDSTVLNFGKIPSGKIIEHTFTFTNTGDQILELKDVRPTCGCTVAGAWTRDVEAGKTGTIPIRFSSPHETEEIAKTVIVECNDPTQTNVVLWLKGATFEPLEISPPYVMFGANEEYQTNQVKVIHIVNHMAQPFSLSEPECTNRLFQTSLKTIKPGQEYELQVTLIAPFKPGTVTAPITLKTTVTSRPVIKIAALAAVQPVLAAMPAKITLPPDINHLTNIQVVIQNNGVHPAVLSNPVANVAGVKTSLREVTPGRRFELVASFPAGFQIQQGQQVYIQMETTNPRFPRFKVPVYQSHYFTDWPNKAESNHLTRGE